MSTHSTPSSAAPGPEADGPSRGAEAGPEARQAAALAPALGARATSEELRARYEELAALEAAADAEEAALGELRAAVSTFEARYKAAVGPRYKELDRLEAEIAEAFAALSPDDPALAERARRARARADATAEAVDDEAFAAPRGGCGVPSIGLKRLYRRVAFEMHPDRCADADEAAYRNELMIEANRAYREGDLEALEALLAEGELAGERASSLEERSVLARIARARRRLLALRRERDEVEGGELFELLASHARAAEEGRDMFKETLDGLDRRISRTRARLDVLLAMGSPNVGPPDPA